MSVPDWMIDAPQASVDDLAALVRRLARSLRKAAPDNALPAQALDYLDRKGLKANILRAALSDEQIDAGASALVDSCISKGHWQHASEESKAVYRQHAKAVLATLAAGSQAAQVPEGYRLLKDTTHEERSFPGGDYWGSCYICQRNFYGKKRQQACRACEKPAAPLQPLAGGEVLG